jgi:hypothetical protein
MYHWPVGDHAGWNLKAENDMQTPIALVLEPVGGRKDDDGRSPWQRGIAAHLVKLWNAHAAGSDWTPAEDVPDDSITVLGYFPTGSEPIWPCYYDSASECWRTPDNIALRGAEAPSHWRHFPEGPEGKGGAK